MRTRDYLAGLTRLHLIDDPEERRAVWRQSLATLGSVIVNEQHPAPLEGLDPDELLRSVERARADRQLHDLDWLSGPLAAASLYEFAAALPPGDAKRELGRLVYRRLHAANATTFVALATRLALGRARIMSGPAVRARVALSLDLPIGSGARADALALALISSAELRDEWLVRPATGSLPSRRMAARLIERAAREAAARAEDGDDSGVQAFRTPEIREAWDRLLGDRESLVWRHLASARGLLSGRSPDLEEEIHQHLSPEYSITEWRRAAASLAASVAVRPESARATCHRLLASDLVERDRGLPAALMLGLPRAAEREPEAVEELLDELIERNDLSIAEALLDLRRERIGDDLGGSAATRCRDDLRASLKTGDLSDEGHTALLIAVANELGERQGASSLPQMVADALVAFSEDGPAAAASMARGILDAAAERLAHLEEADLGGRVGRQTAFLSLRELDLALLGTDGLVNLLSLQPTSTESEDAERPATTLGDIFQRLTNWLIIHEGEVRAEGAPLDQFSQRLRRLQALVHLVDADGSSVEPREPMLRARRVLSTRVLLNRLRTDDRKTLRRALCAAAARAMDAMVREEIAEVSDAILYTAEFAPSESDAQAISEASMVPELEIALDAYIRFFRDTRELDRFDALEAAVASLQRLASKLPAASSPRVAALRAALSRLARAIDAILQAGSLAELQERAGESPLVELEQHLTEFAQLVAGARRRLAILDVREPACLGALHDLDNALVRAMRLELMPAPEPGEAFGEAVRVDLPDAFARLLRAAIGHVYLLPLDAPRSSRPSRLSVRPKQQKLPAWMPPGRTLGGFYVTEALGVGAGGSVFIAKRAGERHTKAAELFALKVPDYSGAAARTLSEAEFLRLFREEAGALLALPEHPHIARFVTFDAGARPKPILVMELVKGPSLEKLLETNDLDMRRAFDLLDGVAAGLEAMHAIGVAHLDVKPSNIIVRLREGGESPVLVDFGLAGRHLRPGCGTAEYGAPEVWGAIQSELALPVDVYAFCCMAYELVTNDCLFVAENELGMINAHVEHDGAPDGIKGLGRNPPTSRFAQVLRAGLRQNPAHRATITQVRAALAEVRADVEGLAWPLGAAAAAS